jgi:tetratricopeptide (TPR) repeat protein
MQFAKRAPVILALVLGCGASSPSETQAMTSGAAPAREQPSAASSEPPVAPTTPVTPPTDGKPTPPTSAPIDPVPAALPLRPKPTTPEEAAALRRELLALLDAGRKAAREDQHAEAIAKYREALTIEPNDPTVLGELGWAAYKGGDLQLAHGSTLLAIRNSGDPKQLGALHYNLGRIAEDQGQLAAAVKAYQTSLELRDNKTVKARLAEVLPLLPDDEEDDDEDEPEARPSETPKQIAATGLARLGSTAADLAAACTTLTQLRCSNYSFGSEPCTCEPALQGSPEGDASWGLLSVHVGSNDAHVVWFPVVQTSAGWVLFSEIAWAFNPGTIGILETVSFEPTRTEPLLSTDSPPILFTFSKSRADSDMALNELEQEQSKAIVICTRDKDDAWCTMPLVLSYEFKRDIEFPEDPGEQLEHQGLPITRSYAATASFSAGSLALADVLVTALELGRLGAAGGVILPKGSYGLRALLGR